MIVKICTKCKKEKGISDFSLNKGKKSGFESWCRKCTAENSKKWYHKNKSNPKIKQQRRDYKLQYDYGITLNEYDIMLEKQNGVCAICGCEETNNGRWKTGPIRLSVDHNHKTNKVRGLLCNNCNTALGGFRVDELNINLLLKATEYIRNT